MLRRNGKSNRAKDRRKWQRKLSQYWQQRPISHCEVVFSGCVDTYGLAPAHSKDRFDIHTEEDFREVVAACKECHWKLDREMPKDERLIIVKQIISRREI